MSDADLVLETVERAFAEALITAINQLRAAVSTAGIEAAVRAAVADAMEDLDKVLDAADFGRVVDLVTRQVIAGATSGEKALAEAIRQPTLGFRFDQSDPRAILWARQRAGLLIRGISDEVRLKVSNVLVRLLDGQLSRRQAANEIARNVGLHERWQRAVDNSYDSTLKQLLDDGFELDAAAEMAQVVADKYAQQLIRARAKNIARTELATAQNQGRYLLWQQAADQGYFVKERAVKEWRTAPEFVSSGAEVCPICEPMNGVRAPVDADFAEVGVLMPPAHPNCRCRAVLIVQPIERVAEELDRLRDEIGQISTDDEADDAEADG